jgi:hypothetical protein
LERELEEHEKEIRKVKAEMGKLNHNKFSVLGGAVLVAVVVMLSRVLMGE